MVTVVLVVEVMMVVAVVRMMIMDN